MTGRDEEWSINSKDGTVEQHGRGRGPGEEQGRSKRGARENREEVRRARTEQGGKSRKRRAGSKEQSGCEGEAREEKR